MNKARILAIALLLLGIGAFASAQTVSATLSGAAEVPGPGDTDGSGFATITFSGTSVSFTIMINSIAAPTSAHVHRGSTGAAGDVVINLNPTFTGGLASGTVTTTTALAAEIVANPGAFYVNVHNGDFPNGAIRGQLAGGAATTEAYFPVISRADGLNSSKFRTNLRIGNPNAADITVQAEWYPDTETSAAGAAKVESIVVVSGGQAVVNDAVQTLFAAGSRNGAMRLVCASPFQAMVSIYNDQRTNTTIPESLRGTYAQFSRGLAIGEAYAKGMLLGLSDRRDGTTQDYRTNLGYFNPTGATVTVTFTAKKPDGSVLGTSQLTIPGYANKIKKVFDVVTGVPAGQQTQLDFFVTYQATGGPLFVYASPVDNKTGDGLNVVAQPMS